jgi:hypothetical protein
LGSSIKEREGMKKKKGLNCEKHPFTIDQNQTSNTTKGTPAFGCIGCANSVVWLGHILQFITGGSICKSG